jgi:hypothetical protein
MSFTPTKPVEAPVPGPQVDRKLDKLHILRLDIQLRPGQQTGTVVEVTWVEGFMEGENYKWLRTRHERIGGEALDAKLAAVTTGGSLYEEVRKAVWSLLQELGHIGAGTVG